VAVKAPDWRLVGGAFDQGTGGGGDEIAEVPIGTKNGSNTIFTLTYSPTQYPVIWLFLNGDFQTPDVEFTLTGNTITYATAPTATDEHFIIYHIGLASPRAPGTARSFAGGTDQLDWGHDSRFELLGDMAIGFWIKLPSNAAGPIIGYFYITTGVDAPFVVQVAGSSDSWGIKYGHDYSGGVQEHTFSANLRNSQWYYIGLTRDGTAKTVALYVSNGSTISLIETWSYSFAPGGSVSQSRLAVGFSPDGLTDSHIPTARLTGTLQEHYIWSSVRTSDEHLAASNGNPITTDLVLRCQMGNTPEQDLSSAHAIGTVTGTTLVQGHS